MKFLTVHSFMDSLMFIALVDENCLIKYHQQKKNKQKKDSQKMK